LTRWRSACASDTGLVRTSNQDASYVSDSLAVVADGMGGHAAGEVASAMTIDVVTEHFLANPTIDGVVAACGAANREVLADAAATPVRAGMGTTLLVLALVESEGGSTSPVLFHVGDSRAYQVRDGALRQLTEDHSVAEEWVRLGRLTPEEALTHPNRHQLTRAIGVDQPLEIDVKSIAARPGDRVVLCSDGLSNELSPDEIAAIVSADEPLDEIAKNLVAAANLAGGRDNITAVVVEFDEVSSGVEIDEVRLPLPPTPPPAPVHVAPAQRAIRSRRLSWRAAFVTLIVAGILTSAYAIVHWYAYSSYYIGAANGNVVIYQGQPGGVLWFSPKVSITSAAPLKQFRPADQASIRATISEPSVSAALEYLGYLHGQWQLTQTTATTTTTVVTHG